MKVIVAGSRHFTDFEFVKRWCDFYTQNLNRVVLVCGMAPGVDMLAYRWAEEKDYSIAEYPADWDNLGKAAGPIRNRHMAEFANALIAFWDGKKIGSGTYNMIQTAKEHGLKIRIVRIDQLKEL